MHPYPTIEQPSAAEPLAHAVLDRIRSGDREVAARLLTEYEGLIRRRFRQRLGRAMRRLFDSQEVFSTICRRFDAAVRQGQVRADSERQLWVMVFRIGDHALADKCRIMARLERLEGPDSEIANELRCRLARADRAEPDGAEIELDRLLQQVGDPTDRQIIAMWLNGQEHAVIAGELQLTHAAVRKRWERIRTKLHAAVTRQMEF